MIKLAEKYLLAFPKERLLAISKLVGKAGCFEVLESWPQEDRSAEKTVKEIEGVEYRIASLDFAVSYLMPFVKKESLLKRLKQPKIIFNKEEMTDLSLEKREQLFGTVRRLEKIERKLDRFRKEEKDIANRLNELEKFGSLGFIPQETHYTVSLVVCLQQAAAGQMKDSAEENAWHWRELTSLPGKAFWLLFMPSWDKEKIGEVLKNLKAEVVSYNFSHPPAVEKQKMVERLQEIAKERLSLKDETAIIARHFSEFKIFRDLLAMKKTNLEVRKGMWQEGILAYLVFWAFKDDLKKLHSRLAKFPEKVFLIKMELEEGEEPPVALENHKLIRPFQYVTEIFGMPRSNELDPTPFLAFFFILFFGICLTDAGYGLVLIIFTLAALLFLKKALGDNRLIVLLFYGGIATVIMGVLFGGYFGAPASALEKWPWLLKLKKIDPIKDTVLFMILAFALGYLQVFFAQIVKIISGWKNKNRTLSWNGLAWALFYVALVMVGISFWLSSGKTAALLVLAGASLFLLWMESGDVGIFLKPLVGAIKVLQGLIGTISDVLSYSRLVALGLATGVIALIVNQIAILLGSMVPYIGFLVTALIMIGGHIFNLGINALGAFIHSGRLQFVEFFPKFLEGGGKRLRPQRAELKYIQVENLF